LIKASCKLCLRYCYFGESKEKIVINVLLLWWQ